MVRPMTIDQAAWTLSQWVRCALQATNEEFSSKRSAAANNAATRLQQRLLHHLGIEPEATPRITPDSEPLMPPAEAPPQPDQCECDGCDQIPEHYGWKHLGGYWVCDTHSLVLLKKQKFKPRKATADV